MKTSGWKYKWIWILALMLITIGVGSSYINDCHDWGDDFAQYLVQSRAMATGNNIDVTCTESYSPSVRGPLFSILLLPIVQSAHVIAYGKILVLVFVFGLCTVCFLQFRKSVGDLNAFLLSALLVINFSFVRIYDQILTDIPFSLVVAGSLFLLNSERPSWIKSGILLAGIAPAFRDAGFALLPVVLWTVYYRRKQHLHPLRDLFWYILPLIVISVLSTWLLNRSWPGIWYLTTSVHDVATDSPWNRIWVYRDAFLRMFEYEIPVFLNPFVGYLILLTGIAGFLMRWYKQHDNLLFFVIVYLLTLAFYPYTNDPQRLLLPVIPFWLFASVTFIRQISGYVNGKLSSVIPVCLLAFLILANIKHYPIQTNDHTGVCSSDARELISFISKNIAYTDVIACEKPWAVNWFTNRKTVPASCMLSETDYLILGQNDGPVPTEYQPVFQNESWTVYSLK